MSLAIAPTSRAFEPMYRTALRLFTDPTIGADRTGRAPGCEAWGCRDESVKTYLADGCGQDLGWKVVYDVSAPSKLTSLEREQGRTSARLQALTPPDEYAGEQI